MEENKNEIHVLGHIFSIETIIVISLFIVGIIIIIIGLIVDSQRPHIKKPITIPTYNTQQSNIKYNNIIYDTISIVRNNTTSSVRNNTTSSVRNNTTSSIRNNTQKEIIKQNLLIKIDDNYSTDSEHVYFGQQEYGKYLLHLDKNKIKIVGDYITDGKKLYNKSQEIQIGNSNINLNNLQKTGKTYLKDNTNVYASVYTYNINTKITTYRIEKLDIDINHLQFFLEGEWEYIKDKTKIYYVRGDLYTITTLNGKNKNGIKKWSVEGDTSKVKGQLYSMEITDTKLIDFIKSTPSVYVKDLKKINENYSTDGKKLYYINKNSTEKEIELGNYNVDFNSLSVLGKHYIKDKNNIYSISHINGRDLGITKLSLDMKNIQFLSGQYEYINYNNNKKIEYWEYIKDKNKVYSISNFYKVWIVSSISSYGDNKRRLNLLNANNNKESGTTTFINKAVIDFLSTVVPIVPIK